jgi:hypothetical protein
VTGNIPTGYMLFGVHGAPGNTFHDSRDLAEEDEPAQRQRVSLET